jgi:hypothetical protein
MKVKRIQKRQPLQKNKVRKLIKGTRLAVKPPPKKKSRKNPDPNAYIDVKPIEFDPYDLLGRSTLKVCPQFQLCQHIRSVGICQQPPDNGTTNDLSTNIYGKEDPSAN